MTVPIISEAGFSCYLSFPVYMIRYPKDKPEKLRISRSVIKSLNHSNWVLSIPNKKYEYIKKIHMGHSGSFKLQNEKKAVSPLRQPLNLIPGYQVLEIFRKKP